MPLPSHTMRSGILAQLLSSTRRSDTDSEACGGEEELPSASRHLQQLHNSPHTAHVHHSRTSPRCRHHVQSALHHRPISATLRCRAPGCIQRQCADGVGGLCVAHAILHLPVQQLYSGDKPLSLAAYQRKLKRQSKPPPVDGAHSQVLAPHVTSRSQSYHSYRHYQSGLERQPEDSNGHTIAQLPDFSHRLPTVSDLRQEGLQAFAAAASGMKRVRATSRDNSRRSSATQWSATAPVGSVAIEALVETQPSYSCARLFHPRRTPAGLTLERANTAADAVRLLRSAALHRPHTQAPTNTTTRATSTTADTSIIQLAPATHDTPNDLFSARPPSVHSASPLTASHSLLVSPAKHMKLLSAVEEQRLYRADLLARLMQRPPVASLQLDLLERLERLFAYRPPHATLCSRQLIRSHVEHETILAAWREKGRRLNGWLKTRCALVDLYSKRAVWDETDSVRSRIGRLDEWMAGRVARHIAGKQQQVNQECGMSRWHFSTFTADEEWDTRAVCESQLSIVVLEASPRSETTARRQSAKGSPQKLVPQLALPQVHA